MLTVVCFHMQLRLVRQRLPLRWLRDAIRGGARQRCFRPAHRYLSFPSSFLTYSCLPRLDVVAVIDWNLTKEEFDKLRKSLVFDLSSERIEHAGNTANITIHDCLNKFIGQYKIPEWYAITIPRPTRAASMR